ncbi:MAG: plasmid pRiA4b ORF-3 family protein [Rectinema sp.]
MGANENVYQIKIRLKHVKPAIWRKFLVEDNMKLPDFHKVIQTVMGWTNSHLHQFVIKDKYYGEPDEDSFGETIDYKNLKLKDVLTFEKQKIIYEYDFGDGWEHEIVLEKIFNNRNIDNPICLSGKRNCPPEDSGGPYGYMDLLEVISDPTNEDYKEMKSWIGEDFDPEYFDKEVINELLATKDYGCISLLD